jgi:hypothetical protein
MITQELLHDLFHYDCETGYLTRRRSSGGQNVGAIAGCLAPNGYRVVSVLDQSRMEHRIIWMYVHGEWPEEIDHINRDRADNRISNLRSVHHSVNQQNIAHKPSNNKTGFVGVSFRAKEGRKKKYVAEIKRNKSVLWREYFLTPEEAAAAYVAKKREFHPHTPLGTL